MASDNGEPDARPPFAPMPIYALGEMGMDELLDEFDFAATAPDADPEVRFLYKAMVDAVGRYRFARNGWDAGVLHRLKVQMGERWPASVDGEQ